MQTLFILEKTSVVLRIILWDAEAEMFGLKEVRRGGS